MSRYGTAPVPGWVWLSNGPRLGTARYSTAPVLGSVQVGTARHRYWAQCSTTPAQPRAGYGTARPRAQCGWCLLFVALEKCPPLGGHRWEMRSCGGGVHWERLGGLLGVIGKGWTGRGLMGRVTRGIIGKGLGWRGLTGKSWTGAVLGKAELEGVLGRFTGKSYGERLDWDRLLERLVSCLQPLAEAAEEAPGAGWGLLVPPAASLGQGQPPSPPQGWDVPALGCRGRGTRTACP